MQDDSTSHTVAHVVENPPADEAGIQIGDAVLTLNGQPSTARTPEDLIKA